MEKKKILALVGSNNQNSINQKLVQYVSRRLENQEVKLHEWINFNIPVFGLDQEKERGIPADIRILKNIIDEYEFLIIAVNEHNKTISAFFKNILDWISCLDSKFLDNKKVLLMSTSESDNGAVDALNYMKNILPNFGAEIVESFSFPYFSENFDIEKSEIKDEVVLLGLLDVLINFEQGISN